MPLSIRRRSVLPCEQPGYNPIEFTAVLSLNLLPPEEKFRLQYAMWTRAVIAIGGGLSLFLIAFIVLLLPTLFVLKAQEPALLDALNFERRAYGQEAPSMARDVRALNRLARLVNQHASQRVPIYTLLTETFRDTPTGVRLQEVSFQAGRGEVAMAGFSSTRSALLEFIRALERSPRIASVSSPLSNLVRETDIAFTLVVKVR